MRVRAAKSIKTPGLLQVSRAIHGDAHPESIRAREIDATGILARIVIPGVPVTKKNSARILRRRNGQRFVMPSKASVDWTAHAVHVVAAQLRARGEPIAGPVHVCALIYRARDVGDLDNYLSAVGDMLQSGTPKRPRANVIVNDKQIKSWDGSRPLIDRANPRVEIVIRPFVDVAR